MLSSGGGGILIMSKRSLLLIVYVVLLASLSACGIESFSPATSSTTSSNTLPVAEAGQNRGALIGQSITFNADDNLDVDNDTLSYKWVIHSAPVGSSAVLTLAGTASPQLVPDLEGLYILSLVVNDGVSGSSIDFVTITVSATGNTPPECVITPNQGASTGSAYTVNDVLVTDADNDALTYLWTLESIPDQSSTSLTSDSVKSPVFVPDTNGEYYLRLVASDATHDSQPCLVSILASSSPNALPVAYAGLGYGVFTGTVFAIDGSKSFDLEGAALTYEWSVINAPPGSTVTLTDSTSSKATVQVDMDGYYSIKLIVNDGVADSRPSIVLINASSEAGIPQNVVTEFSSVCLAP